MIELWTAIDNRIQHTLYPLINSARENCSEEISYNILCGKSVGKDFISEYKQRGWNVYEDLSMPEIQLCGGRITEPQYFRWMIPFLSKSDRAIYIDNDAIVLGDLAELIEIDLSDSYVAAVPNPYINNVFDDWKTHAKLGTEPAEQFKNIRTFLSGQIVINCREWRKDNIMTRLIDCVNKYRIYDNAAMNIQMSNRITELPFNWFFPGFNFMKFGRLFGNKSSEIKHLDYVENTPKIIHWCGPVKPYDHSKLHIGKTIFHLDLWNYYDK